MGLSSNQAQSQINNTVPALVSSGIASAVPPLISAAVAAIPSPQWIKVTKTYTDFATAALTNDISIYTLPIKGYIHDIKLIPRIAFAGGTISAVTLSVGIGGALTKYCIATNSFTGNTTVNTIHTPLVGLESTSGTTDIRSQIVAVGVAQTLNNLTAGTVDFYLLISTLP